MNVFFDPDASSNTPVGLMFVHFASVSEPNVTVELPVFQP